MQTDNNCDDKKNQEKKPETQQKIDKERMNEIKAEKEKQLKQNEIVKK